MSNTFTRKYGLSDAVLLAHVGKVLQTLPSDLSSLEPDFPLVNQAFVDGLVADHTNALTEGGDDVARGQVGQLTQNLLQEMDTSKRIVKRLRFWVNETFRDNPAQRKAFNLGKYWRMANSQPKLVQFMNALNTVAAENSAALLNAGMGQQVLDDLSSNATALAEADAQQESSKGGRTNATQERIVALNSLYERSMLLDRVTDIVFEEDPAKLAFYSVPTPSPKAEDLEEEVG